MEYQIKQLSYYAKNILRSLTIGTIHSVYRRTINLTNGTHILSLQADGSVLSPISLICKLSAKDMNALSVMPGDTVFFDEDGFKLYSAASAYHFNYANASLHDLELSKPLDRKSCMALSANIRTAVSAAATGGFAPLFHEKQVPPKELPLILRTAKDCLLQCEKLCLHKDYRKAALMLSRLLGLGTGLTPSGDDFLCGVLAGLFFTGNSSHPFTHSLKSEIAGHLSDTLDISAAFLSLALKEQFSLPVNNLCQLPSPEAILASFKEIGHSSGTDTLCGILFSLERF